TSVPPVVLPGSSVRFHLLLRPNLQKRAHWNNEVGSLVLWVNPPEGWTIENHLFTVPNPRQPVSQEVRRIELEARCLPKRRPGAITIPGYLLYYVCEDVHGTCLYRRQDVQFNLEVASRLGPVAVLQPNLGRRHKLYRVPDTDPSWNQDIAVEPD